MKVKLSDVMEAVENAGDDMTYYYNKVKQEVTFVMEFDSDDEKAELEENWGNYLRMPSKFEVNDYHIMEEFIWSLTDERQQAQLANAISGRGAFRYFRDVVDQLQLTQKWYNFRDAAHEAIAREWCDENGITIEDD